jgi:hypothetical protein
MEPGRRVKQKHPVNAAGKAVGIPNEELGLQFSEAVSFESKAPRPLQIKLGVSAVAHSAAAAGRSVRKVCGKSRLLGWPPVEVTNQPQRLIGSRGLSVVSAFGRQLQIHVK